jgi:hypothetical protein
MAGQVVGTWRLKVFGRHTADGNVSFPLGPDAVGYLAYTPDGYVFVSMMRRERPALVSQSWIEPTLQNRAECRGRSEPGWRYRELATGDDAMSTTPRELAGLLLELAWRFVPPWKEGTSAPLPPAASTVLDGVHGLTRLGLDV